MRKYFYNVLGVAVLLIVSCVLTYPNPAFAIPPLSDSDAKKISEEGKNQEYTFKVSDGTVKVTQWDFINNLKKLGVISYTKRTEGINWIDVTLTEKGKKYASTTSEKGVYRMKLGEAKITKIVKNSEYKTPLANPDEELRIVMGIYKFTPTELGKEFWAAAGIGLQSEYKFRALLKYEPFKEKYIYVLSDYGYINKDKFETNKIENYNFPLGK